MPDDLAVNYADALSAPLGDLIAAVGRGMAEAQQSLDLGTLETFKAIYKGGTEVYEELRQLGYQPTWYKIPELNAEISVSLTASRSQLTQQSSAASEGQNGPIKLYAAPMDANYQNKYDYDLKAASVVKFRILPVPPTPQASEIKVVPELKNKSYGEARFLLAELGIPYGFGRDVTEPADTVSVRGTDPEAGKILSPGRQVILKLAG